MPHKDPEKRREYHRKYMEGYRATRPPDEQTRAKRKEYNLAYRAKNLDALRSYDRERYEDRKARGHFHGKALKTKYGLTLSQYDALLLAQDGKCAVCGETAAKFDVDHDHREHKVKGKPRGLLCRRCNIGVGYAENVELMEKIAKYLLRF